MRAVFVFMLIVGLLMSLTGVLAWYWIGVMMLGYGLLIFFFSMNMRFNFFAPSLCKMPTQEVMLTFDDGPHPVYTPRILDILQRHQVKALFFLIGKQVEQHPEIVERMIAEGHQIGGHSQRHTLWFGLLGHRAMRKEIMNTQCALSEFTHRRVIWFRPPFGVVNPQVAKCVAQEKLSMIGWNVRSYDTATSQSDTIVARVCERVRPGSIVLLHDRLLQTVEALESIITSIRDKGLALNVIEEDKIQGI